jgi:hypothetical protein
LNRLAITACNNNFKIIFKTTTFSIYDVPSPQEPDIWVSRYLQQANCLPIEKVNIQRTKTNEQAEEIERTTTTTTTTK